MGWWRGAGDRVDNARALEFHHCRLRRQLDGSSVPVGLNKRPRGRKWPAAAGAAAPPPSRAARRGGRHPGPRHPRPTSRPRQSGSSFPCWRLSFQPASAATLRACA
ncbi:hypothetical protein SETIT_7G262900v2 [Setaria italica]|uniref:Uncharacterized protein n=1 Tax=Setaria italica TaxID=4555 RepID=A0A368S062_SETIT|nr:hypothetical protein SETIT_7G262900v2 [Setaria italica]